MTEAEPKTSKMLTQYEYDNFLERAGGSLLVLLVFRFLLFYFLFESHFLMLFR